MKRDLYWLFDQALQILDPAKAFDLTFNTSGFGPDYAVYFPDDEGAVRYSSESPHRLRVAIIEGARTGLTWAGTRQPPPLRSGAGGDFLSLND